MHGVESNWGGCGVRKVGSLLAAAMALAAASVALGDTLFPAKDGTIVDGLSGPFDGVPDEADWTFNESSYEGAITLATDPPESSIEHRVVWEYDLGDVTLPPPVTATLTFKLRPAPIFPHPDVEVHVVSYPADLEETLQDFSAGPAVLQGIAVVPAFPAPTAQYVIDVSGAVSSALSGGVGAVAFRFQIDPQTPHPANQTFIDALDSNPLTKPILTISEGGDPVPGDHDGDGDVDRWDYAAFFVCAFPGESGGDCDLFDFNADGAVDLLDFGDFQSFFTGSSDD